MNTNNQTVTWSDLLTFLSPAGQHQIVEFVRRAQTERGANWLPEIQAEFPMFSWIVDLVCNHTADEALSELAREFPYLPLELARGQFQSLHARLRVEIERKR